jgi:DNA adenine methylase
MSERSSSVIRWAGSKRKLLPLLRAAFERSGASGRYIEPFAGSAALFFELQPKKAVLSDANRDLVDALNKLKRNPDDLYSEITSIPKGQKGYYLVRDHADTLGICKEARFFYLNRFCFNGIYRTNKSGKFNVPYGGAKTGNIPTIEKWRNCSSLLNKSRIICADFASATNKYVESGDFVYLDPPYAVSNRRIFKQYSPSEFGLDDVARLREVLIEIDRRGAKFLVSYAQSPETKIISEGWFVARTQTQRNIAGFVEHRRRATEVLISNFPGD